MGARLIPRIFARVNGLTVMSFTELGRIGGNNRLRKHNVNSCVLNVFRLRGLLGLQVKVSSRNLYAHICISGKTAGLEM